MRLMGRELRLPDLPVRSAVPLAATLAARIVSAVGGLALGYWLARATGAQGLGQFTYIQSIIGILALFSRMGSEHTLLRLLAGLDEVGRGAEAFRYFFSGVAMNLALAVSIALLAAAAGGFRLLPNKDVELLTILIWSLPPLVMLGVTSGYLRGHRMVGLGMLLDIGTISGLTAVVAWSINETGLSDIAIIFVVVSAALAVVSLGGAMLMAHRRYRSSWRAVAGPDLPAMRSFLLSGWPFAVIAISIFVTQAGSFALAGSTLDDRTVGLLRATERFAILIGFAQTAITPFLAPRVAAGYARSGARGIQPLFRQGVLISLAAAVPVAVVVGVLGKWLLGTLGDEFVSAYPFLLILGFAQLIQASFGASNVVLIMAGGEKAAMQISVATLIAACFLFPLLCREFGGYGFAAAYLLLIMVKEGWTFRQVQKFGRRSKREIRT